MLTMQDVDFKDKIALLRVDFNVPLAKGHITDDERIKAAIPTINFALQHGAKVLLLSHCGQPKTPVFDAQYSLQPVADYLATALQRSVRLVQNWLHGVQFAAAEQVLLLENVRFVPGETDNDAHLAEQLAALADIFVLDAFATLHRNHASNYGIIKYAKVSCAGLLLQKELAALDKVMINPARPLLAIVGGAKVSTKLAILQNLINLVDILIVGGGIANTFLAARNYAVGASLYEPELVPVAREIMQMMQQAKKQIVLPVDVVVAKNITDRGQERAIDAVNTDEKILDFGVQTQEQIRMLIQQAKTIIWNGPVGLFEQEQFATGTDRLAQAIADSHAFTLAGGGDTLAAIARLQIKDKISYISTGGGAFLDFLAGTKFPALALLNNIKKEQYYGTN